VDEETFNLSVRKFLKTLGVTAQWALFSDHVPGSSVRVVCPHAGECHTTIRPGPMAPPPCRSVAGYFRVRTNTVPWRMTLRCSIRRLVIGPGRRAR
jgi:hypothetical protein